MTRREFLRTIQFSLLAFLLVQLAFATQGAGAQDPIPTPTQQISPGDIYITVITEEPQINVRLGPGASIYPVVGTLPQGAVARAFGRSPGGDWVQIEFAGAPNNLGWVYSPLVQVSGGTLQIAEPPPTPKPPPTSTIDPTLIAQFHVLPTPTRLPTFTPPATYVVPVFTQAIDSRNPDSIPLAVVLMIMGVLGSATLIISFFIRRR